MASPQVCFFIFVPPPGPQPLHCDLVMSLYAHRHYRKNTTFVTLLLCGGLVVITYIQLLGWAVLKGNGGYKAWYTLATKSNSIRLTLLKVDCCWNWQQSRLLPDTFSFVAGYVQLCCWYGRLCVYEAKATRSTSSTFHKVDLVEFNFVDSVWIALEITSQSWPCWIQLCCQCVKGFRNKLTLWNSTLSTVCE